MHRYLGGCPMSLVSRWIFSRRTQSITHEKFSAQINSDKWAFGLESRKLGTASFKPYFKERRSRSATSAMHIFLYRKHYFDGGEKPISKLDVQSLAYSQAVQHAVTECHILNLLELAVLKFSESRLVSGIVTASQLLSFREEEEGKEEEDEE
ncbi:hypothetical protein BDR05DRAFT_1059802 [Suillus weaverae]|nr:hypothetical protein BDR05DRAFT_1059802 [Suillus weaverae]